MERCKGAEAPAPGEWWLVSPDALDPTNRNEEEEHWAEILSYTIVADGPLYSVQDLGEAADEEPNIPLNRYPFVYVFTLCEAS